MSTPNHSPILARLRALKGRIRLILLGNSLFMFTLFAAALAAGSYLLDLVFHLPIEARAALLLIMVGTMLWGAARFFLGPFRVELDDDALALMVQQKHPEWGDELITAVQLQRRMDDPEETESKSMMAAAVAAALERFSKVDFRSAVSAKGLRRPALYACIGLILLGGYGALRPDHAGIWLDRSILLRDVEWPPDTVLEVTIPNIDEFRHEERDGISELWLPEGATLRVLVRALGEVPPTVRLVKYGIPRDDDKAIMLDLPGRPESNEFVYSERVTRSFEFHVTGGDDEDERPYFRVNVRTAPRVDDLLVDYDYPAYINEAGKPDRRDVREYNVVGPRGTEVEMRFRTSTEVTSFQIVLDEDEGKTLELDPVAEDARLFVWRYTLDQDRFYTYRLIGRNGAPSREAPNFNISAQPDLAPEITIRMPEATTIDVSARAVMMLEFIVTDDHRVGTVRYRYDYERDGDFEQSNDFGDDAITASDDDRENRIFATVDLGSMQWPNEAGTGLPLGGDQLFLALEATDTRSTADRPEPNVTRYPSTLQLNVREPAELERDLTRGQSRIKEKVEQVKRGLEGQVERTEQLLKSEQDVPEDAIHALIAQQSLLATGLADAERLFLKLFDGYVFNRLAPSALTESLVASFIGAHARESRPRAEVVAEIVPTLRRQIDETEPMGKLTRIMDLMITAGRVKGPAVDVALKNCLEADDAAGRRAALPAVRSAQNALVKDLDALLDRMEDWEDFQDLIQGLKDIIEIEKGLWERTKKIAK